MNKIVKDIIDSGKFNYCHVIEVSDIYELKSILDQSYDEFIKKYTLDEITEFFDTITIYCLVDENEDEVYNFNLHEYLEQIYKIIGRRKDDK